MGTARPRRFFAMASRTSKIGPTRRVASSAMAQVRPAISQARKPAFTDSSTMTRSRGAYRPLRTSRNTRRSSKSLIVFACLPAISQSWPQTGRANKPVYAPLSH